MNPELIKKLQESIDLAKRLSKMLREDREDMAGCVNGEVLAAYRKAADAAEREIKLLRDQLVDLQERQLLGL